MTRVLVTGATGFLGRALVPRLIADGMQVTAHGRRDTSPFAADVEYLRAELTDPALVALTPWRWDALVNLAGPVTGGAEDWKTGVAVVHAHVQIALQLRRAVSPTTRIVHTSSMTVYGDPDALPVGEQHVRQPRHLYALGKSLAEEVWLAAPELDAWVVRLPGLFSRARRTGALYHFCRAAQRGEPVRVTTPVPTPWDVMDVEDAVEGLTRALRAEGRTPGAINLSYGDPVELVAVASWIAGHAGRGSVVEHPAGVTHPTFQLDIALARRRLGWAPASLYKRLAALYAAYQDEAA